MITTVSLIRHGESVWNASRRWQGFAPVPLNEVGFAQAAEAGEILRHAGVHRIISSDLLRTRQTADTINTILQVPIEHDARLREINVGSWQGLTLDEIMQWDPVNYQIFHDAPAPQRSFPNGESYTQLSERMSQVIREAVQQHPGEHLLLVSHGGSIRAAVIGLIGKHIEQSVHNCSITRLTFQDEWSLLDFACTPASVKWQF